MENTSRSKAPYTNGNLKISNFVLAGAKFSIIIFNMVNTTIGYFSIKNCNNNFFNDGFIYVVPNECVWADITLKQKNIKYNQFQTNHPAKYLKVRSSKIYSYCRAK